MHAKVCLGYYSKDKRTITYVKKYAVTLYRLLLNFCTL